MPTIMVSTVTIGEDHPDLRITPIQVTAMAITENEMQTIPRMS